MVHDGNDIVDKDYKNLCAEMYSEGHSFFTYVSDSADSLASCCRLRNELAENTFNPTIYSLSLLTRVRAPHKPSSREIVVQVID
jgi:hypothetical protein